MNLFQTSWIRFNRRTELFDSYLLFQNCSISHRFCFFTTSDSRMTCSCWGESRPHDCRRPWSLSIQLRSSASSICHQIPNMRPNHGPDTLVEGWGPSPTSFWAKRSSIFSSRVLLNVSVFREVRRSSMARYTWATLQRERSGQNSTWSVLGGNWNSGATPEEQIHSLLREVLQVLLQAGFGRAQIPDEDPGTRKTDLQQPDGGVAA